MTPRPAPARSGRPRGRARLDHAAPGRVGCAIITVSDTRGPGDDLSGDLLHQRIERWGHRVVTRTLIRDEIPAIRRAVRAALARRDVDAVLITGGTGVAGRDVTPEAVDPLVDRWLPGFGELFRMLSFDEVGAMALLSRATAGIRGERVVFVLPGSPGAVRLAAKKLILPVLGHLVAQLNR